jgi:hypothetical protein
MFKIATEHARRTGGEVLTPEQTVKALEERLSAFKSVLVPAAKEPEPAPSKAPDKTSLRNKDQTTQKQLTSTIEDDETLFRKGLEAAKAVLQST